MKHSLHLLSLPLALALSAAAFRAQPAAAGELKDADLADIKFDQHLDAQVSPDLAFVDETGTPVTLGDYFQDKPVILVLGYYECPMLCNLVLNGLVESLQDLRFTAGSQFQIVNVSIDPRETPSLAAAKKKTYLKRYGRHGAGAGWHFLTGQQDAIEKVSKEVGFHFAYDSKAKQFAHPSGIVILTPHGKVARYFFGVRYSPQPLHDALVAANQESVGSPVQQLLLLCFHYSPLHGKYGPAIMKTVRAGGIVTMIVLGGIIVVLSCRDRKKNRQKTPPGGASPDGHEEALNEARNRA